MSDGLYTLKMKGEKQTYAFRGSEQHTLDVICKTLSDMTGYKAEYLKRDLIRPLKISGQCIIAPANSIGSAPTFIVRRVS